MEIFYIGGMRVRCYNSAQFFQFLMSFLKMADLRTDLKVEIKLRSEKRSENQLRNMDDLVMKRFYKWFAYQREQIKREWLCRSDHFRTAGSGLRVYFSCEYFGCTVLIIEKARVVPSGMKSAIFFSQLCRCSSSTMTTFDDFQTSDV